MDITEPTHEPAAISLPEEVYSPNAKLVYLYLGVSSNATIDELHSSLGLGKMALFSVLDSLSDEGFVEKRGHEYTLT